MVLTVEIKCPGHHSRHQSYLAQGHEDTLVQFTLCDGCFALTERAGIGLMRYLEEHPVTVEVTT